MIIFPLPVVKYTKLLYDRHGIHEGRPGLLLLRPASQKYMLLEGL